MRFYGYDRQNGQLFDEDFRVRALETALLDIPPGSFDVQPLHVAALKKVSIQRGCFFFDKSSKFTSSGRSSTISAEVKLVTAV